LKKIECQVKKAQGQGKGKKLLPLQFWRFSGWFSYDR